MTRTDGTLGGEARRVAEVGIAHYVVVDPDGPITEFVLDAPRDGDRAYRLVATHGRTAPLSFGPPLSLPAVADLQRAPGATSVPVPEGRGPDDQRVGGGRSAAAVA